MLDATPQFSSNIQIKLDAHFFTQKTHTEDDPVFFQSQQVSAGWGPLLFTLKTKAKAEQVQSLLLKLGAVIRECINTFSYLDYNSWTCKKTFLMENQTKTVVGVCEYRI